jgi:hypothetical protein
MTTADYPDRSGAAGLTDDSGATATSTTPTTPSTGTPGQGSDKKEQAKQAAGTAADEGKKVAGVAQGEAQRVASEAKSQASGLLNQATSQVEDQSRTQRDRLAGTLGSLGDLDKMAAQSEGGLAADLAREVADRAHSVSSHLRGREPRELLDDLRDFARRRPGLFLGGALVAGIVAGRLTRGARDANSGSSSSSSYDSYGSGDFGTTTTSGPLVPRTDELGTAAGAPLAGTGAPIDDPAYPTGAGDATGGLPNPAGSVSSGTTYTDAGARGDLS